MNILTNAVQAISEGGQIELITKTAKKKYINRNN